MFRTALFLSQKQKNKSISSYFSFSYFKSYFKNDLIAGFSVFLLALPLCLGIAIASNFPPAAGIISAVVGGILTSFFGGAKLSIKGPAAGLIAIALAAVNQLGNGDLQLGYERTLAVGFVAALLQILIALLRKATLVAKMPSAVIHGMLAAIGVIILAKQTYIMMGLTPESTKPLFQLFYLLPVLSEANPLIFSLGLLSLVTTIFWPLLSRFSSKFSMIPTSLLILVIILPLSLFFDLSHEHTYNFVGNTYSVGSTFLIKLPHQFFDAIRLPDFSFIFNPLSIKYIIIFALVGSIESLLTVCAVDSMVSQKAQNDSYMSHTQEKAKSSASDLNKDLFAVGLGNLVSSFLGGLPMISEIVRSKANIDYGAESARANFFHGFFMLIAAVLLPSIMNLIPLSALAALLVFVGFKLASLNTFIHAFKEGIEPFFIFCTTFLVTLSSDLLIGVATGTFLTYVFHLRGRRLRGRVLRNRPQTQGNNMSKEISVRKYQETDARALADIYYHTIHNINSRDYSEEQINAWAPISSLEPEGWKNKWAKLMPFVAVINDQVVGFAEFENDGHIDCFYVHHNFQSTGIGSVLLNMIEKEAKTNHIDRIYAEVSITAKPFFQKKGFKIVKKQSKLIRGVELTNFIMEKCITI